MGIWFYEAFGQTPIRSVVKYGKQPNTRGPWKQGYSVVMKNQTVRPDWCIGNSGDPLVIEAKDTGRFSWKIADENWTMRISLSVDGGEFFEIGYIRILANYGRFDVYINGNNIVIHNGDSKLGRAEDGKSFPYFHVTYQGIEPRNASK